MMQLLLIHDTNDYDKSLVHNQSPMDMIRLLREASEEQFGRPGDLLQRVKHADLVLVINGNQAVMIKDRGIVESLELEVDQVMI